MKRTWEDNADEFGALTKQGKDLRLALLVACSVERKKAGRIGADAPIPEKVSATAFANRSGTDKARVIRHLDAWDRFAKATGYPLSKDLTPDEVTTLEISEEDAKVWEDTIVLSEKNRGSRGKATPDQIREQIKSDPKARQAALDAAVESGDVQSLSTATAKAAKNKQVERNRQKVAKGQSTKKPKPKVTEDKVLMMRGISDALVALNTTIRAEWASLTPDEQQDQEIIDVFNEGFDQIQISLDAARVMVIGGVSDDELEEFLAGGAS